MSNDLFPAYPAYRGLAFTIMKAPEFDTLIKATPTQIETRLAQNANPVWHWVLTYNYLKDRPDDLPAGFDYSDFRTLLGFILKHQGQFDDFLFLDPDDYFVGPAMLGANPNLDAQLMLVQDYTSGTWYSPVQRSVGGLYWEDIAELKTDVVVYANGVLQTEGIDYSLRAPGFSYELYGEIYNPVVSHVGYYLEWASEPAEPITAQFEFYWRVRFETDQQDLDKFMNGLWAIGGPQGEKGSGTLALMTARKPVSTEIGGDYTLPLPWAFWNMNETSGTRSDASGNGNDWASMSDVPPALEVYSTTGKIRNAARFLMSTGTWLGTGRIGKAPDISDNKPFFISFLYRISNISGNSYAGLYFTGADTTYTTEIDINFSDAVSAGSVVSVIGINWTTIVEYTGVVPIESGWHLFFMYYDGVTLTTELDNVALGSVEMETDFPAPGSTDTLGFWTWADDPEDTATHDLDTVGIWVDAAALQMIAKKSLLWNGGTGREYPI
jgi:hypothetical protein